MTACVIHACTCSSPISSCLIVFAVPAGRHFLISTGFAHFHRLNADTDTVALGDTRYSERLFVYCYYFCWPNVYGHLKSHSQLVCRLSATPKKLAARSALATYAAELCSWDSGVVTTLASQAAELFLFTRQCQPGKRKKEQGPQHTRGGVPSVEGLTTRNGIESN